MDYFALKNNYKIPSMILGTYQIPDQKIMDQLVDCSFKNDLLGFDTSPSYGTEVILGNSIKSCIAKYGIEREKIFITDKIDGIQMCKTNGNVESYIDLQLKNLRIDYFDLLLIHWPFIKYLRQTWSCLEKMVEYGKVKSIGLCNVNSEILDEFLNGDILIFPQVIQNEISPLNSEINDINHFKDLGIISEAYSSLCRMIDSIRFSPILTKIAEEKNKSIPQIILRWNYQRGIVSVFKSTKPARIEENLQIFDFELSIDDMKSIDSINQNYRLFPQSYGCPG